TEYRAELATFHSSADDDEEESSNDDLDPTITETFDNDTSMTGNVDVVVFHFYHPLQLIPDKFSFRFARGTKVSYLKDKLVELCFGKGGWTSREMSLMINPVTELDDDDTFDDNAEITLKLTPCIIDDKSTTDSNDASHSNEENRRDPDADANPEPTPRNPFGAHAAAEGEPTARTPFGTPVDTEHASRNPFGAHAAAEGELTARTPFGTHAGSGSSTDAHQVLCLRGGGESSEEEDSDGAAAAAA
ncbi:MAG: hypothetical protein ACKPKO_26525, partial [Candidatus Fonsibacter sp.]